MWVFPHRHSYGCYPKFPNPILQQPRFFSPFSRLPAVQYTVDQRRAACGLAVLAWDGRPSHQRRAGSPSSSGRVASPNSARASKQRQAAEPSSARASKQRRAAEQRSAGGRASGGRAAEPPASGGRAKQPPCLPPPCRGTDGGCQLQHGCTPTGSVLARASCWLGRRSSLSPCTLGAWLCSENGIAGARRSARAASGTASAGPGHSTGARRRLAIQAHLPSAPREVNISNSPSPLSVTVTGDAPIECFVDLMLLSN